MTLEAVAVSTRTRVRRRRGDALLITSGAVILVLTAAAILAPWIVLHDPNAGDVLAGFAPPSLEHPLGTDSAGRDILSRIIAGSQSSLLGGLLVMLLAGTLGSALGMLSAWKGGWFDSVLSSGLAIVFAFPGAIIALIAVSLFGPSLTVAVVTIAVSMTPALARVVRAETLRQKSMPYMRSAWLQGMSGATIGFRHLLPNVSPVIVAQLATIFGYAMLGIATLSFLGLGIRPPDADWGVMIADGKAAVLQGHPAESLWAGVMLIIAVMAFTTFADALSARFEGRTK
jgi:peptide/nickel transport system permease protein